MLGILLYEEDQFENALSYFNKVNEKRLNRGEKLNFRLQSLYIA